MSSPSTSSSYALTRRPLVHAGGSAVRRTVQGIVKSMLAYYWKRQTVDELSRLPSYILRDIGLNRGDILEVATEVASERAELWARQAQGRNGFGG